MSEIIEYILRGLGSIGSITLLIFILTLIGNYNTKKFNEK